jgi:hypothetical protein
MSFKILLMYYPAMWIFEYSLLRLPLITDSDPIAGATICSFLTFIMVYWASNRKS